MIQLWILSSDWRRIWNYTHSFMSVSRKPTSISWLCHHHLKKQEARFPGNISKKNRYESAIGNLRETFFLNWNKKVCSSETTFTVTPSASLLFLIHCRLVQMLLIWMERTRPDQSRQRNFCDGQQVYLKLEMVNLAPDLGKQTYMPLADF